MERWEDENTITKFKNFQASEKVGYEIYKLPGS